MQHAASLRCRLGWEHSLDYTLGMEETQHAASLPFSAASLLLLRGSIARFDWSVGVHRASRRIIGDGVEFAISHVHPLHFLLVEWPRAATSKYRELIPALVHATVAIGAFGDD